MKRIAIAALLLVLALPSGAAAPPAIDACALLDAAQIERVIRQAVEPGVRHDAGIESNGAWSSSCVWTLAAERGAPVNPAAPLGGRGFVILNAMRWPAGSGRSREFLESFREAALAGVIEHAPAPRPFGDEALWWGDGLAVRKGDVSFGLSVHLPRTSSTVPGAWEEGLAPLVLNRIDRRSANVRL
ncbi:MAG: hypothetical protein ACREVL_05960 [Solimonas sp.]